MNSIEYTDFIMHHGIKGQRWGIRRFQNEDGSLTPEGEKRYNKTYKNKTLVNRTLGEDVSGDTRYLEQYKKNYAIQDEADALSKEYYDYYNNALKDPEFIEKVNEKKKELKNKEYLDEYDIYDAAEDLINNSAPKSLLDKRKKFDADLDNALNETQKTIDKMVADYSELYKNTKYKSGTWWTKTNDVGKDFVNKYINENLDFGQLGWMYRHIEYWFDDLEPKEELRTHVEKMLSN